MTQTAQKTHILAPNVDAIKCHLRFLSQAMKGYDDGKLEISILNHSETFDISEIDAAAEQAIKWNSQGMGVYAVGALLNPSIIPHSRSCDDDFYASSVVWCDIDNPIDPAELKFLYDHCPPAVAIITARKPARRIQLWWKLDTPCTDSDTLREALQGIQQTFKSDGAVTNQTSLMRLGGTVNYPSPSKAAKGRISELTEYHKIHDKTISMERLLAAYPIQDYFSPSTAQAPASIVSEDSGIISHITDGREQYMSDMIYTTIVHLTEDTGRWPTAQEVFDDAWPVYSRKVKARPGRTLDQDCRGAKAMQQKIVSKLRLFAAGRMQKHRTIAEIAANKPKKIETAFTKPAQDEPTRGAQEKMSTENGIKATNFNDINMDSIPPREFLYGNIVARKYVSMIVAPPGVGKSIFTLCMAISAASGRPWGAWSTPQDKPVSVWVYNNEEGFDELRRRIKAVMDVTGVSKNDLGGRLYVDSGEHRAIEIAKLDQDDSVIYTPDYEALRKEVVNRKIDILVIDPFAETYNIRENDNDQIKNVTRLYRQIAVDCGCAVLLVHHTRKGMEGGGGQAGNIDMARGGGAQIGVVRRAFTLAHMNEVEAKKLGVPQEQKKWFIRMDDAKTNITAPADRINWLRLKSVNINNGAGLFPEGDSVGVLIHTTPEEIMADFAGQEEAEFEIICLEVVKYMDDCRLVEASISQVVKSIVRQGTVNYKSRKLHDKVVEAINYFPKSKGIMHNGTVFFLSIPAKKGRDNATIIRMEKEPNEDY